MKKIKSIAIFLVLVFSLGSFKSASAIEYQMLGGKPAYPDSNVPNSGSWFIYNLNLGKSKEDGVEVMNLFDDSWEALIYAADTTKSSGGGFALKQFSEEKKEVGSWVRFYPDDVPEIFQKIFEEKEKKIIDLCEANPEDLAKLLDKKDVTDENFKNLSDWCQGKESVQIKLSAKERKVIPFIIKVPENAEVGEHTGGILIQKIDQNNEENSSGSAVKLTTRLGVRIYETVPGEIIKKLSIENFSVVKNFKEFDFSDWLGKEKKRQEYLVQLEVKNEGNVSIENENIIQIKDLFFGKRSEDVARTFQALRRDSFDSNYSWYNPRFGKFSFTAEVKYDNAEGEKETLLSGPIIVWVIPWREGAIAATIILLAFSVIKLWKWRKNKKYGIKNWTQYEVKEGDDINKVSQKFNISWKILAKTNKIKPPFLLEAGKAILVPPLKEPEKENKTDEIVKDKNSEEVLKEIKEKTSKDMPENNINNTNNTKASEISDKKTITESVAPKKNIEDFFAKNSYQPETSKEESFGKKKAYIIAGIIILVLAGAGAGVWAYFKYYKNRTVIQEKISIMSLGVNSVQENENQKASEENKAEENNQQADKAEKKAEVKPSEVSVKVLNGGAVAGSAGKIKSSVIKLGYEKVEAGNAKMDDHTGQAVYYSGDLASLAQEIADSLKSQYPGIAVKQAESEEEKSAQIVIMLGK